MHTFQPLFCIFSRTVAQMRMPRYLVIYHSTGLTRKYLQLIQFNV